MTTIKTAVWQTMFKDHALAFNRLSTLHLSGFQTFSSKNRYLIVKFGVVNCFDRAV